MFPALKISTIKRWTGEICVFTQLHFPQSSSNTKWHAPWTVNQVIPVICFSPWLLQNARFGIVDASDSFILFEVVFHTERKHFWSNSISSWYKFHRWLVVKPKPIARLFLLPWKQTFAAKKRLGAIGLECSNNRQWQQQRLFMRSRWPALVRKWSLCQHCKVLTEKFLRTSLLPTGGKKRIEVREWNTCSVGVKTLKQRQQSRKKQTEHPLQNKQNIPYKVGSACTPLRTNATGIVC